ncbi:MAG: transcriptional repressor [Clostridia bacterium]|nr:transcriptional repressor [Clostridia bacterium]
MKYQSRQRNTVLRVLCSTTSHPTAAWIYEKVREEIPNISLGTVYRNLSELSEDGIIKKLSFGDASVHFDGDTSVHSHFYCEHCGDITDIWLDQSALFGQIETDYDVKVRFADFNIAGKCGNCSKKEN